MTRFTKSRRGSTGYLKTAISPRSGPLFGRWYQNLRTSTLSPYFERRYHGAASESRKPALRMCGVSAQDDRPEHGLYRFAPPRFRHCIYLHKSFASGNEFALQERFGENLKLRGSSGIAPSSFGENGPPVLRERELYDVHAARVRHARPPRRIGRAASRRSPRRSNRFRTRASYPRRRARRSLRRGRRPQRRRSSRSCRPWEQIRAPAYRAPERGVVREGPAALLLEYDRVRHAYYYICIFVIHAVDSDAASLNTV